MFPYPQSASLPVGSPLEEFPASPPKTVLSAPPTPHHRSGSGSPSLTRCGVAPGSGDPAAAVWHRPTPSPRSPTFSVRRASLRPTPWRGVGDERVTSSSPAAARVRATRSHNCTDWSREPGPGRQTRARLSGSRSSSPPPPSSLLAPTQRPSDPRSRPGRPAGYSLVLFARCWAAKTSAGDSASGPARCASLFQAAAPCSQPPRRACAAPRPALPSAHPLPPAPPPPRLPPASPRCRAHLAGGSWPREVPRPLPTAWRRRRKRYKVGAPRLRAEPRCWHKVIVDWGVAVACKGTPVRAAAASQPRSSEGHLHRLRPAPRAAAAGTRAWPTAGML